MPKPRLEPEIRLARGLCICRGIGNAPLWAADSRLSGNFRRVSGCQARAACGRSMVRGTCAFPWSRRSPAPRLGAES